jgi:hypothetical protein
MQYLFGFLCVYALGATPLVGCSETTGNGGSGGTGGTDLCEGVTCEDTECKIDGVCDPSNGMCDYTSVADGTPCTRGTVVGSEPGECLNGVCAREGTFPCTEQGIRDAIATGGERRFFACDGPTTVVTEAEIVIDNDVILDGEGNLTVEEDEGAERNDRLFTVAEGVTAELWHLVISKGGGIFNFGTLTMTNCIVSDSAGPSGGGFAASAVGNRGTMTLKQCTISGNTAQEGGGITNGGTMTLTQSTVSGNDAAGGGGIFNYGTMTMTNCTVSGNDAINRGGAILNSGIMTIISSTVAENTTEEDADVINGDEGTLTIRSSLIDGDCGVFPPDAPEVISTGYNIESPGNTCGFDQEGDQADVTAEGLNLGPLADNLGATLTHALGEGSVAIDQIPEADCVDADGEPLRDDQRNGPRPAPGGTMCDVGSFEVQPEL